jgi:hypothetical protein
MHKRQESMQEIDRHDLHVSNSISYANGVNATHDSSSYSNVIHGTRGLSEVTNKRSKTLPGHYK